MMYGKIRGLAVAVGISVVLAACTSGDEAGSATGGSTPAPDTTGPQAPVEVAESCNVDELIAATAGMTAEEREAYLLPLAVDGPTPALYLEIADAGPALADLFDDLYGLDLNIYRAGSADIRQRAIEESAAGFKGFDVVEVEALEALILQDNGVIAKASSPHRANIADAGLGEYYSADRYTYVVAVWNPTIVDAPTSLEDMTSDKYKGLIAFDDSDVYWFAVQVKNMVANGMTEEAAVQIFRDIAAQSSVVNGHTSTLELIVAGQYGITPNGYSHRIKGVKEKGAIVDWLPLQIPPVAEITSVSVACNASNPAAALLLEDFMLRPDGAQAYIAGKNRIPGNIIAQEQLGAEAPDMEPLSVEVGELFKEYQKWSDLYDELLRLASK